MKANDRRNDLSSEFTTMDERSHPNALHQTAVLGHAGIRLAWGECLAKMKECIKFPNTDRDASALSSEAGGLPFGGSQAVSSVPFGFLLPLRFCRILPASPPSVLCATACSMPTHPQNPLGGHSHRPSIKAAATRPGHAVRPIMAAGQDHDQPFWPCWPLPAPLHNPIRSRRPLPNPTPVPCSKLQSVLFAYNGFKSSYPKLYNVVLWSPTTFVLPAAWFYITLRGNRITRHRRTSGKVSNSVKV